MLFFICSSLWAVTSYLCKYRFLEITYRGHCFFYSKNLLDESKAICIWKVEGCSFLKKSVQFIWGGPWWVYAWNDAECVSGLIDWRKRWCHYREASSSEAKLNEILEFKNYFGPSIKYINLFKKQSRFAPSTIKFSPSTIKLAQSSLAYPTITSLHLL